MEETGFARFPGHLDPRAQEFRPRTNPSPPSQIALVQPHIYYPYPPPFHSTSLQFMPFYDAGALPYQPPQSVPCFRVPGGAPPPATAAPTRSVVLSSVPVEATEEGIRRELEVFGEVRAVEMGRLIEGFVTVHFYNLRHAQAALTEIRERHMEQQSRLRQHYSGLLLVRPPWGFEGENSAAPVPPPGPGVVAGRAVWAQFAMPEAVPVQDGGNQGTIVVFNLDSGVSGCKLKEIFEAFGPVKELRETPLKKHQRFVEFFDIRDAARAIKEMDGKEINGKRVLIEFSRPGGCRRRFSSSSNTSTFHDVNINSSINNINGSTRSSSYYPRNSIRPPTQSVIPKSFRRSSSNASSTSTSSQPQNTAKKTGLRWNYGAAMASLSINDASHENEKKYIGSSSGSNINTAKKSNNSCAKQSRNRSWKGRHKSLDSHFLINKDAMVEPNCIRDTRTTVMIKNIPNKYSQKLLLNMLDNHCIHCNEQLADGDDQPMSSYDFVYLPIDFNNKCNVGYGFVNLTSPEAAWRLYQAFHMQHWEVFNSRKICEITYARLQGLEALKEHFKNSKFACDTDEYLPIVFSPPRDGRQLTEPLAIGGHAEVLNKAQNRSTILIKPEEEMECEERLQLHDHDDTHHDDDDGCCSGGDGDDEDDDDVGGPSSEVLFSSGGRGTRSITTPDSAKPNGCCCESPRASHHQLS